MLVKEIMTKKVDFIDPDTTIAEASKIMRDDDIGCLPVGENDRLVGFITDRDIIIRAIANDKDVSQIKVRDIMSKPVKYCYDDESIDDLAQNFSQNQIHRLPVLNHDKRMVGIVSLGDLAIKGTKDAANTALHGICKQTH